MSAPRPPCLTGPSWLRHRCPEHGGKVSLAPLTSQDSRALAVFMHALELYAFCDADGQRSGIVAMRAAVGAMQPKCRDIAKAAIPHVLDWHDEDRIWALLYPDACADCGGPEHVNSTCDDIRHFAKADARRAL